MESGFYPPGAEYDSNAPYNQVELPEKEIEVTISVTLSKTMKVMVDDYRIERNDYGNFINYDFSDCDIHQAVKDQLVLPQDLAKLIDSTEVKLSRSLEKAVSDCKDWDVDDLECIIND